MSKHRKPAPKAAPGRSAQSPVPRPQSLHTPPFFKNTLLQSGLIFAFAFLLYANTLTHGFVMDDSIVITKNMFTQKGVGGIADILSKDTFFGYFKVEGKEALVSGGRYRPLTLVLFALVFQLFGENSFVFHLLTVALFAATCVVLYRTLLLLLEGWEGGREQAPLVAWASVVLFAAHPIHTEVVANIKSCDEIVALLCSLGLLWALLRANDTGKTMYAWAGALLFFLGLMSKENALTMLAVAPLALWVFRKAPTSRTMRLMAPNFLVAVVWLVIRYKILGWSVGNVKMDLINNPFVIFVDNEWVPLPALDRLATVFYTLGKYVALMIFPHPLTSDYYPRHIAVMHFSNFWVLLSVALYGFLLWWAAVGILKGKREPARFGVLFFLLTLSIVSNLFFPIGTNMAERFVFMPSVGLCIVAGVTAVRWAARWRKDALALGIFAAVVVLFSAKTVMRNFEWASNRTLSFTDVKVSKGSARMQASCGDLLCKDAFKERDPQKRQQLLTSALGYLDKAIEIHPSYVEAYSMRGNAYYLMQNYQAAIADYRNAVRLNPKFTTARNNLALSLRDAAKELIKQGGSPQQVLEYLTESNQLFNTDPETIYLLGVTCMQIGQYAAAIQWFETLMKMKPGDATVLSLLAQAYEKAGDLAKAAEISRLLSTPR